MRWAALNLDQTQNVLTIPLATGVNHLLANGIQLATELFDLRVGEADGKAIGGHGGYSVVH